MRKKFLIVLLFLLAVFIIIQFFPVDRPENDPSSGYNFFEAYEVPPEVEELIRNSCFDCHSQEVKYPWYAYVAPASWLVAKDVRHGQRNLDFSNWYQLSKEDRLYMFDEIADEVGIGSMPLKIYVRMHSSAGLSEEERELIIKWADETAEMVFEE